MHSSQGPKAIDMVAAITSRSVDEFGGYITGQEAAGGREMARSDKMPKDMRGERHLFEKVGFVFGEDVAGDDLFLRATLPPGWKKEGTDHSMWTKIVDEKGRERVGIFYKAAFYDRSATATLNRRFTVNRVSKEGEIPSRQEPDYEAKLEAYFGSHVYGIFDAGVHRADLPAFKGYDSYHKESFEWLKANLPDWQDPSAYWDDEPCFP